LGVTGGQRGPKPIRGGVRARLPDARCGNGSGPPARRTERQL